MDVDRLDASDPNDARPGGFSNATPAPPVPESYSIEYYDHLEDQHFEYHMKNRSRGVAIIINNDTFPTLDPRVGSALDRERLLDALNFVGFTDIRVENNLTRSRMIDTMIEASYINYKDKDCLFVAILSHGDEGIINAVDEPVTYSELMEPFKADHAVSLRGKPKIFVIQACRGTKFDDGAHYTTDALPPAASSQPMPPAPPKHHFISKESDFVVAYSTVPGYYSWRNQENGSWFIQAFCTVMKKDGRRLDFLQIMSRVNHIVSYMFKSNSPEQFNKKQCSCVTSMLTKALLFG